MDDLTTSAIFLLTGFITAAGAHPDHPMLEKAKSQIEDEQYEAALFTAKRIIAHYPNTEYAKSARALITLINKKYLKDDSLPFLNYLNNTN